MIKKIRTKSQDKPTITLQFSLTIYHPLSKAGELGFADSCRLASLLKDAFSGKAYIYRDPDLIGSEVTSVLLNATAEEFIPSSNLISKYTCMIYCFVEYNIVFLFIWMNEYSHSNPSLVG